MQAQAMRMVNPSHWAKMHIVRCGINLSALPQVNNHPAKEAGPIKMICVGRLSPEKGYFGLLDALANLRADTIDFEITIVGDGPSGQKLHDRVAFLGLSENVCFTGFLPEVDTLDAINQSDIFILPSLMEGLPVVLIEALALRKAAIASRVAGIPELIKDGHSGLLFTPSDWTDLERQIRRTVRNRQLRESLGRNGRSIVEKNFQSRSAAKQLAALFLADPLNL
jgi:glycosyltransferase involved in cell wall biosynthesis